MRSASSRPEDESYNEALPEELARTAMKIDSLLQTTRRWMDAGVGPKLISDGQETAAVVMKDYPVTVIFMSPQEVVAAANKEFTAYAIEVPEPVKPPKWDWCSHGCSIFTMVCCCWAACISSLFGLIGLVLSVGSYSDYTGGNYDRSKYKKSCAIGFSLAGVILGLGALGAIGYFGYTNYSEWLQAIKTFFT
ncbi:hypothetical protein LSH36_958g00016 [Paralvinella palmiformis]|uniref:Uncharacterized protein n=1 Tax=Paralvinella palmiformis TaxID=53620 RepID=A0AAD9MSE5_9ANNE|nr:hypothetical protein LSH36_958g00016 [Paralvinella palmiformis]